MDADTFLNRTLEALKPFIHTLGGVLKGCEDELDALEYLAGNPGGWCALCVLSGGKPQGVIGGTHGHEQLTLTVFVAKPTGMPVEKGAGVYRETAAGLPLLRRVGQVRREIQRLIYVDEYAQEATIYETADTVDSKGWVSTDWQILTAEDAPENHHAARLTFTIQVAFEAADPELARIPVGLPV